MLASQLERMLLKVKFSNSRLVDLPIFIFTTNEVSSFDEAELLKILSILAFEVDERIA